SVSGWTHLLPVTRMNFVSLNARQNLQVQFVRTIEGNRRAPTGRMTSLRHNAVRLRRGDPVVRIQTTSALSHPTTSYEGPVASLTRENLRTAHRSPVGVVERDSQLRKAGR